MKPLAVVLSCGLSWLPAGLLPAQFQGSITLVAVPPAGLPFAAPFGLVVVRQWPAGWTPQTFDAAALAPLSVELVDSAVTQAADGSWQERREYRARATTVGNLPEQAIPLRWQGPDGAVTTAVMRRPALRIGSVLPAPPGEIEWAGSVRDLPGTRGWLWLWLGVAVVTMGVGWLFVRGRRRAVSSAGLEVGRVEVGPEVASLEALAALRLPEDGASVEVVALFYTQLKELVRDYAGRRFELPAFVRSSEELLGLVSVGQASLGSCLSACDRVLFGALRPATLAHEAVRRAAETFVREAAVAPSSTRLP